VLVTQANGDGLTPLTAEPLVLTKSLLGEHWDRYQFSPDGQTVVIASSENGVPGITIAQSDGTGARSIKTGMAAAYEPSYRPPNGAEILFVGRRGLDANHGLFVIDASSGAIRTILAPSNGFDLALANWSRTAPRSRIRGGVVPGRA
jgi:Tol biopolymer transport system component